MKVAYYDKGNLRDNERYGLGIVYNERGNPILRENEKILAKEDEIRCLMYKLWKFPNYSVFADSGYGAFYRTNQRLIYIREPQPLGKLMALATAPAYIAWAKDLKRLGLRECFEISLDEIIGIKKKRNWVVIFISSKDPLPLGTKYGLQIIPFKPFLLGNIIEQKSVENVKELKKRYP